MCCPSESKDGIVSMTESGLSSDTDGERKTGGGWMDDDSSACLLQRVERHIRTLLLRVMVAIINKSLNDAMGE
jgi:hypothetical protein